MFSPIIDILCQLAFPAVNLTRAQIQSSSDLGDRLAARLGQLDRFQFELVSVRFRPLGHWCPPETDHTVFSLFPLFRGKLTY